MSQEPPQNFIDSFVGAAHGDFETVKTLLAQYPDLIQFRAAWQESAIEAAAQMGRVDIAEYLLAAGAPLEICTAAMLGRFEQVQSFLRDDPGLVNARGAHGIPLMYYPVIMDNLTLAEYLFSRGCPLNGGEGVSTPLHGAIMFNQVDMVRWLLQKGARTDMKDFNGHTPLQAAKASQRNEIVQLLQAG